MSPVFNYDQEAIIQGLARENAKLLLENAKLKQLLFEVFTAIEDGPGCEGIFKSLCKQWQVLKKEQE